MATNLEQLAYQAPRKPITSAQSEWGQFPTPQGIAQFMASLFPYSDISTCRLLDAGAGAGALTVAFLDRWLSSGFGFANIQATAYEIDDNWQRQLAQTLAVYQGLAGLEVRLEARDFIPDAVRLLREQKGLRFTHIILNPPYKKLASNSQHRHLLREVGIETVNLYSAFVALATALLEPHGQLVAIIPRSFCNGPYYRPFREFIMDRAAIRHLHLFGARNRAFRDHDVLQENIIIRLERGASQGDVTISTSTDAQFDDYAVHEYPFAEIVAPDDAERFIHVPTAPDRNLIQVSPAFRYSLSDLGVEVSTGPVVDFRLKAYVRDTPGPSTVPLLYPAHFTARAVQWPKLGMKKPNALLLNAETRKWLFPSGYYAVVRRFSSKEEKRRIVASVVTPGDFAARFLGFENHLNVFHQGKQGLPEHLARGLMVYLSATAIDAYFRRFSGHTQVNAADLRMLKYPSREALNELGRWASEQGVLTQEQIDHKIEELAWPRIHM